MASTKHNLDKPTLPAGGTEAEAHGDPTMFALTVLYHPDLERIGERALLPELSIGKTAPLSRSVPLFAQPGHPGDAEPLGEERLSRTPVRLKRVDGGVRLEKGDSSTAVRVRGEAVQGSTTFTIAQIHQGVVLELAHRVVLLLHFSAAACRPATVPATVRDLLRPHNDGIIGESDALYRSLAGVCHVADLDVTVLLRGETGTGKELMAHAIHRRSPRSKGPIVAVNLAAIPPSLASSALFGAEKGAFTDLKKRQRGYFEQADGGTLFLDEVGAAPAVVQFGLLRAIESREILPLGAERPRKVDVRIIAATDADLESMVRAGSFHEPLLHRLASFPIRIPPLRERRDDIGRLLKLFLEEAANGIGEEHRLRPPVGDDKPWFPARLAARLCEYDWPGNIRQLRNVVRSLVVASRTLPVVSDAPLTALLVEVRPAEGSHGALPPASSGAGRPDQVEQPGKAPLAPAARSAAPIVPSARKPAGVTDRELAEALGACGWSPARAARLLGIKRESVYQLMKKYGLSRPFRGAEVIAERSANLP